ncbi:MAG: acyl-CoA dehydratase activase-related protein [Anaeromicrobium sp.]|jgi:predicted nucleotide-binding protein (sugar kinase/HSP70/actin superfamily)|uniref:acyl-CoA dehydratase activase-related protein n=1 Tax=Anaeromicrobium sp. TaxID=1929132 RepID=UPI0025DE6B9C|nr:acyl-CoA dehydratase activase-related protein [Anaeromicrobium sp.]MCT4594000.1 acyl-CoA dehydratase activase-related protein [Anaeromicrobium sp.]
MTVKVGIPRALLFYEYYPLWKVFFEELGAKVIVSQKTNKEIVNKGIKSTINEACIPVKIYHGHVLDIKDKVDYLFIPRLKSVCRGEYICPKFCGLPEMIKYSIKDLPQVIYPEIDFMKNKKKLKEIICEVGKYFTNDSTRILSAYDKAYSNYKSYKKNVNRGIPTSKGNLSHKKKVMVMAHSYNLYDTYMNMDIINKIQEKGIDVFTPEIVHKEYTDDYACKFKGNLYWTFAKKLIGTALYMIDKKNIHGIVYISTFGCGIDSVVAHMVENFIRKESSIPFMLVTLDEHSGEAGINTRVEAFVDMIKWRDINENNISSNG